MLQPRAGAEVGALWALTPTGVQLMDKGKLILSSCGGRRPPTVNATLMEENTAGGDTTRLQGFL